jgi:hypothetical protein
MRLCAAPAARGGWSRHRSRTCLPTREAHDRICGRSAAFGQHGRFAPIATAQRKLGALAAIYHGTTKVRLRLSSTPKRPDRYRPLCAHFGRSVHPAGVSEADIGRSEPGDVVGGFATVRSATARPKAGRSSGGSIWPHLERSRWSVQRRQADVHSWGVLATAADRFW